MWFAFLFQAFMAVALILSVGGIAVQLINDCSREDGR